MSNIAEETLSSSLYDEVARIAKTIRNTTSEKEKKSGHLYIGLLFDIDEQK